MIAYRIFLFDEDVVKPTKDVVLSVAAAYEVEDKFLKRGADLPALFRIMLRIWSICTKRLKSQSALYLI